ncbi:site-2 protease family protein [Brevibacillus fulvus]|uniref:Zn-dependent protease n=1 Tax=Brevibacillus fulvus TaxID=1125967 RepID=A0A938XY89_9BACL|nr:site-2 protease family protein [Brevibacillus fulvus]MBM7588651.1 Zn-dependent protease [Brevibacillus fulvus]
MDFSGLFNFDWKSVPFRLIAFVIAFSLHEWAHAYVAWKLGDDTAKREGRLTVNPLPHIDPFGLILILFGPFGWARPVPVNPLNFRGNKRKGMVLVAAAGPFVNLVLALLFTVLYGFFMLSGSLTGLSDKAVYAIHVTLISSISINCGLVVFNLLPIPPLDGSKIFRFLAPPRWDGFFYKLELYGPWALLLLIFIPALQGVLYYPLYWLSSGVTYVANLILALFF